MRSLSIATPVQALTGTVDAVTALRLSIHDSVHLIHREDWEAVAKQAVRYLRYDHLSALEDAMSGAMEFRYALFHDAAYRPVGLACFHILDLEDNGSVYGERLCKLGSAIGSRIVKELKVRSLVCGNVFHCGDHGAHFMKGVPREQQVRSLEMAMEQLRADERLEPRVSALLFKEFREEETDPALSISTPHTLARLSLLEAV